MSSKRSASLSLRIDFEDAGRLGPGKVLLLEHIGATGSISAAGRAMDMSYRRAWLLVDSLNQIFREPLVLTQAGGRSGGGAELTPFGRALVERYRAMEREARQSLGGHMRAFEDAIGPAAGKPRRRAS
jgi:molybdate transport system regulatory protein